MRPKSTNFKREMEKVLSNQLNIQTSKCEKEKQLFGDSFVKSPKTPDYFDSEIKIQNDEKDHSKLLLSIIEKITNINKFSAPITRAIGSKG